MKIKREGIAKFPEDAKLLHFVLHSNHCFSFHCVSSRNSIGEFGRLGPKHEKMSSSDARLVLTWQNVCFKACHSLPLLSVLLRLLGSAHVNYALMLNVFRMAVIGLSSPLPMKPSPTQFAIRFEREVNRVSAR
eukprot:scaffold287_cov337-Pavlova_lutheri.AAC.55